MDADPARDDGPLNLDLDILGKLLVPKLILSSSGRFDNVFDSH